MASKTQQRDAKDKARILRWVVRHQAADFFHELDRWGESTAQDYLDPTRAFYVPSEINDALNLHPVRGKRLLRDLVKERYLSAVTTQVRRSRIKSYHWGKHWKSADYDDATTQVGVGPRLLPKFLVYLEKKA